MFPRSSDAGMEAYSAIDSFEKHEIEGEGCVIDLQRTAEAHVYTHDSAHIADLTNLPDPERQKICSDSATLERRHEGYEAEFEIVVCRLRGEVNAGTPDCLHIQDYYTDLATFSIYRSGKNSLPDFWPLHGTALVTARHASFGKEVTGSGFQPCRGTLSGSGKPSPATPHRL